MYIEDLIIQASIHSLEINLNKWDLRVVYSFTDQINQSIGFTEKQSQLALRILKKNNTLLSNTLGTDVMDCINNPKYKLPLRTISNIKKLSIVRDTTFGKVVKAEFPFDTNIIDLIRKEKPTLDHAVWSKENKAWVFSLTETNILFLMKLVDKLDFEIDDELQVYFRDSNRVILTADQVVPMVVTENGLPKFINVPRHVPELSGDNLLAALFDARKKAIFTWSEDIDCYLESAQVNKFTKKFLKSDPTDRLHLNSENNSIDELSDIVKYMTPCLFIIPAGDESSKTRIAHQFAKELGFKDNEMSVMFRLSKDSDEHNLNNFIKENGLNSPITSNTKIVFISGKFPKPIIKSKIKFHSIVNFGVMTVHYTTKNFADNHENVIYFSSKEPQREFNFGDL